MSAVSPTSGPVGGDTSVVVNGARFQGGLYYLCRFGASSVNATFISEERLACTTPSHTSGRYVLEISVDAATFKNAMEASRRESWGRKTDDIGLSGC